MSAQTSPGELRHRVDIDAPVDTQDANGDPVRSWVPLGTVWAAIAPLRGREVTAAGTQLLAEMDTRITVRWSGLTDQITAKHRLRHQGTIFNIAAPPAHVKLEQRWIEILARSGANDG